MKVIFSSWKGRVLDNRAKPENLRKDYPDLTLPPSFDGTRKLSGFMGWAGIVLLDYSVDVVEMAFNYVQALQSNSCGKCFPCRVGTKVMEDLIGRILEGQGTDADLEQLSELCDTISRNSRCGIGQLGPTPIAHSLKYFNSHYQDYIGGAKKRPNHHYPYKVTAPCTSACHTGMDVPQYIEHIKEGDFSASLDNIRRASPMASTLGRACFYPCESNCRRANVDEPISICRLKRFAWDWENQHEVEKTPNPNRHTREEKVAVIGGGPAGLSCAYYLALMGYRVTVFEKANVLGGAAYIGIPEYRIPKEILNDEIAYLLEMGIEVKPGVDFGKDETFKRLRKKGYSAFFLATGAQLPKPMGVKGEEKSYAGFFNARQMLKYVAFKKPITTPKKALVVGGGNTAMDCARTFIRIGCKDVHIVYRRTREEMPASWHEIYEAKDEGVKYNFLESPTRIISRKGKVVGLKCQKMELGPPDASDRRSPLPIKDSDHVIEADCVISAIGQDCDISYLDEMPKVKRARWNTIVVNEDTMQTDVVDIFAGGDTVHGPQTLVHACGQGRRAAQSIDQYLNGEKVRISDEQLVEKIIKSIGAYDPGEVVPNPKGWPRVEMPVSGWHLKLRSFSEVELGYPPEEAMEEASRCMRCYIIGMAAVTENGGTG